MSNKFYTAKGDDGYTGLLGSGRVPKYDPRPEAYGTLDEATSAMGLARATIKSERNRAVLLESAAASLLHHGRAGLDAGNAQDIRVPGRGQGRMAGSSDGCHHRRNHAAARVYRAGRQPARRDTRRGSHGGTARGAARRQADARRAGARTLQIVRYLNRLSSLLFVMARHEDALAGVSKVTLASGE